MSFTRKKQSFLKSWWDSFALGTRSSMHIHSRSHATKIFKKTITKKNILYSIKSGLAASLAYICAELMHMEFSFWAPLSTLMVMQMHTSASLEVGLVRFFGTFVGALFGLIVSLLLPHSIEGRVIGLCIVVPLSIFLERFDERFQMTGVTAVLVLLLGHTLDSGAIMFALHRVVEMGIGIVCALIVSLFLWPTSAAAEVQAAVHGQFVQTAHHIEKMTVAFLEGQQSLSPLVLEDFFREIGDNSQRFYRVRKYELAHIYREYSLLAHHIRLMIELKTYLSAMMDCLDLVRQSKVDAETTQIITDLAHETAKTLRWFADPAKGVSPKPLLPLILAEDVHFATARAEGQFRHYSHAEVVQIFAFYNGLTHVARAVSNLQERMLHEKI